MASLKFTKGEESHLFYLRDNKIETHALKINSQYIDLTTNPALSSFRNVSFNINGVIHYLRDKYFNTNAGTTGNHFNKAYKPSRPLIYNMGVPINGYKKYKIAINGNFDVMGWFDFNNTSYTEASHFKGNFSSPVNPTKSTGNKNPGYTVTQVVDPSDIDMSNPIQTMNGEITLTGSISDLTSSDKQIFYKQMTNIVDSTFVNFRVYAKISNDNLIITYGWYLAGYDERCNGNASYSIKIGVCIYE